MPTVVETFKNPGLDPVQWNNACNAMLAYVKAETPARTGRLRDGWRVKVGATSASFVDDVPYASYVNDGTPKMAPRDMTGKLKEVYSEIADKYGKTPGVQDEKLSQADYRAMRMKQLGYRGV